MAKQTKSAVAPNVEASVTNNDATAPVGGAQPVAPAKKPFGKEPNGADIFKRCYVDGKPTPITHRNAKGEVVPSTTPQVKVIANLLETAGDKGMSRKELCEKLPTAGLVTRQPVGRIVSYYQKPMVDNGIITIEKGAAAPVAAPAAA